MTARRPFRPLVILPFFILALASGADAFQRMGLVAGDSVQIAPKGHGELEARCLDEHEAPPTTDDHFAHVYNAGDRAVTVTTDGRTIPLQEAIDRKMVRLSGVDDSSPGLKRIDAVRVQNLTDRPLRVSVNGAAVLGGSGHEPLDVDPARVLGGGRSQREVWDEQARLAAEAPLREERRRAQETLGRLGYYRGTPTGEDAAGTERAIRAFQSDRGLAVTGSVSRETERAFDDARSESARLERINRDVTEFLTLTLEHRPGDTRREYVLYGPSGVPLFQGNDVPKLIDTALRSAGAQRPLATDVYVDLKGFSADRVAAMDFNVRHHRQSHPSPVAVRLLPRTDGGTALQDRFFATRSSLRARAEPLPEPSRVATGPRAGMHHVVVRLYQGARQLTLRVFGNTREAVADFVSRLRALLTVPRYADLSLAQLVTRIRADLQHKYRMIDDQGMLEIELADELGNMHVVEVEPGVGTCGGG